MKNEVKIKLINYVMDFMMPNTNLIKYFREYEEMIHVVGGDD